MLPPKEFLKLFKDVETPEVLYEGNPTSDFVESVRNRTLEGMTYEGVVCKGGLDSRRRVITFKVKSHDWLNAVRAKYGHNPKLLQKLI
jgi:hypothetical protein